MSLVLSSLFLASSVTAQITTSLFNPEGLTDKLGFHGSVVSANPSQTVLVLSYDNQTNPDPDFIAYNNFTVTIGPTIYEYAFTTQILGFENTGTDNTAVHTRCQRPTSTASATCTISYAASFIADELCNTARRTYIPTPVTYEGTFPYSALSTRPAGVETVRHTFHFSAETRPIPEWCTGHDIPKTFLGSSTVIAVPSSDIVINQVVITAGLEKLPSATGSITTGTRTGAGVPMKTAAPAAALGFGVAMAAFVL